jgi:hypothetical protein
LTVWHAFLLFDLRIDWPGKCACATIPKTTGVRVPENERPATEITLAGRRSGMVVPLQIGVWEAAQSTDSIVERPGMEKEGLLPIPLRRFHL